MADSLQASEEGLAIVDSARRRKGWTKTVTPAWFEGAHTSTATLKRFWRRQPIARSTFIEICEVVGVAWEEIVELSANTIKDLLEAPEIGTFYGRSYELEGLYQWVVEEQVRLVHIKGMAGIGKTRLAAKFIRSIGNEFEYIIWRSLLNAPPLTDILTALILFLSEQKQANLPENLDQQLLQLLQLLKQQRCLVILDNVEAILQSGSYAGQFRTGYETYGQLFQKVGEIKHQSCFLLTSREQPLDIRSVLGQRPPVRHLELEGLDYSAGRKIVDVDGFTGAEDDWKQLVQVYSGHPLALELAAIQIREIFSGQIAKFLSDSKTVFQDLKRQLDWHYNRLPERELEIIHWLAINREPTSLDNLKVDILFADHQDHLPSTLQSLKRRLPIVETDTGYSLQPVLMEYTTDQLIALIAEEVRNGQFFYLHRYALAKASAKDYIRRIQCRLLLRPITKRVHQPISKFKQALLDLQENERCPGYAAGNLLNLLCETNGELSDIDLSNLTIRDAYLQRSNSTRG